MGYPEMMRDITEQLKREELIKKRQDLGNHTIIDENTGIYNEKYLHLRLDEEIVRAKHYKRQLSFIMIEFRRAKKLDTTIENSNEKKILKKISDIIYSRIRYDIDLAFRYSEDTFAIILPEVNVLHADTLAQSIEQQIQEETAGNITMHIGIVQCDQHDNAEELIRSANGALLEDKRDLKRPRTAESLFRP